MLPCPGVLFLILGKSIDLSGERPGAARRAQPHIHGVKHAIICLSGERADQALRQSREILRPIKRARSARRRSSGIKVVYDYEIEIRGGRHFMTAKLSKRKNRDLLARNPAVLLHKVRLGGVVQGANQSIGKSGKRLARLVRRGGT